MSAVERMKSFCMKYLNNDIILATARCLQGLNKNSSWFQCSCGEPAPVNNQPVRTEAGLAHSGTNSCSKGQALPRPGGRLAIISQVTQQNPRRCRLSGFCALQRGGGGRNLNLKDLKEVCCRQAGYLQPMKWKGKKCKPNSVSNLESEGSTSFYCCSCSASTVFFLHPVET